MSDQRDPESSPDAAEGDHSGRRRWLRWGFGLVGIGAAVAMVVAFGAAEVGNAVLDAAPWMPLVLAVEGARLLVEAWATRSLYRHVQAPDEPLGWLVVLRAQLLSYPVFVLAPAGRATAEATKAGMLGTFAGRRQAAAVAAVAQAVALVGTAIVSVACALAATFHPGAWDLAVAVWLQTAGVVALGGVMLWGIRRERVGRIISKVLGWIGFDEEERRGFADTVRRMPPLPWRALVGYTASRVSNVALFFVLLLAIGAGPSFFAALRATGVRLIGAAAVDFVPADLGLTEGAFALWASAVGVTRAKAVALGLLFHTAQLTWIAIGAIAALVWSRPDDGDGRAS